MNKQRLINELKAISVAVCEQCDYENKVKCYSDSQYSRRCWKIKLVNLLRDLVNDK